MRVRFYLFCLQQTPPQSDDNSPPGVFTEATMALPGPPRGEKPPFGGSPMVPLPVKSLENLNPSAGQTGPVKGVRRNSAAAVQPGGASLKLGALVTESGVCG